ncbi:MAG: M42 family metallopeptidase [Bacillota bacterium]|nr:M42 family metallopeptidase [Bacillota bacterium]
MDLNSFLDELTQKDGVSGYEENTADFIAEAFSPFVDDTRTDNLGNLIFLKKGKSEHGPRVLICAHMDEIGLMITKIEDKGFLRFTSLGGFDPRTLPGQEVRIYGKKIVEGIIGFKPPHIYNENEKDKGVEMNDLFIDTGFSREVVEGLIRPGSTVAIKRSFITLMHNCRAGKALDDRAGVAVLLQCAKELANLAHEAHVYLVATVQEEVGTRGAVVSTYGLSPDLGIAVDVCHGDFPGALDHEVSPLGKGPVITAGPNIHPHMAERLTTVAEEYCLPYQKDVSPGPTGTDARAIQISLGGIPTGLLSVPLRYMHTSVELVDMQDIKIAGRLLAYFIMRLESGFVEGLSCL